MGQVMKALVDVMHSQRLFYKATETSLEQVVRLARRNPAVRTWLFVNRHLWNWAATWLEQNPRPPLAYYSSYGMPVSWQAAVGGVGCPFFGVLCVCVLSHGVGWVGCGVFALSVFVW